MPFLFLLLQFFSFSIFANSNVKRSGSYECNEFYCGGYKIPDTAKNEIDNGYESISMAEILGNEYLLVSTLGSVNRCSKMYPVKNGIILSEYIKFGETKEVCNITSIEGNIVSSYRDGAKWYEEVYHLDIHGKTDLKLKDSCVGCDRVNRIIYKNGEAIDHVIVSDGDKYTDRYPLKAMINKKSYFYKKPEGKYKSKMYLIENDTVWLKKSNEGEKYFYIIYKRNGESNIEGWLLADSLQMEEDKKSEVYFLCDTKKGNVKLEVENDKLIYSISKNGMVDFSFSSQGSHFSGFLYNNYSRYQTQYITVSFKNGNYSYAVFDSDENGIKNLGVTVINEKNN
ncbi:hypothetical protein [Xenorhabdus szentirmaii]|uniref:hypothetical protein n=1 Tax=Xenorhabdus szentirmaii TaxID=290112 RepID=UPI0019B4C459|nr:MULTISPECIES: hypothetical protein [unclassified Xenorhabdus]MBD2792406.1 hypothetical protein [Xenorhabdus sp. CUL]MBD2825915.1 hypothetical protein [Xenorhabdus sp. 5]